MSSTWNELRAIGRPAFALAALLLTAAPPAFATTPVPDKVRIAFVGDSMSDGLWGGVTRLVVRDACLKTGLELGRFAKNSTGLTRPERFNWPEEIKRLGQSFRPRLYVMSLGLNDRQSVVYEGKITMPASSAYPEKYKERVTAALEAAKASKAALLWVGLPSMRGDAADKDARLKNQFYAEAIAAFGAPNIKYVEPWKLAQSGEDKFASYGPDQNGKIIQIRASDGEHFTPSGELLVAAYLLPKILDSLAGEGIDLQATCRQDKARAE